MRSPVILVMLALSAGHVHAQGNQALHVDGGVSALKVLQHPSLEPSPAMTLECWVNGSGSVSNGRILRKEGDFSPGYSLAWSFQGKPVGGEFYCNSTTYASYDTLPSGMLLGTWHHIAMTCTLNGTIRYFRDGDFISEAPGPSCMDHSGDFLMGSSPDFSEGFIGSIDEVRLWSVERTPDEIKAAYQLTIDAAPGLLAVWHLDGNGDDAVGSNDGVLVGTATFVPSDAPLGFTFSPTRADWLGGADVTLTGHFSGLGPTPSVLFGDHVAPKVVLIDASTLVVTAPAASHPGEIVAIEADGVGGAMTGTGSFTYTPRLDATSRVHVGGSLEIGLQIDPPSVAGVFLGLALPSSLAGGSLSWQLECAPMLRVFLAHAPFQDEVGFRMKIPDDIALQYGELVVQGAIMNPASGAGSFTNGQIIMILPQRP